MGVILVIILFKPSQKEIDMVANLYCVEFQARNDSGLGKPLDILHPRIMTMEEAGSPAGQKFQQIITSRILPLMQAYGWDNQNLNSEVKEIEDLMRKESFRNKVFESLHQKSECHPEYLD